MELDLALTLPNHSYVPRFDDDDGEEVQSKALSLLLWSTDHHTSTKDHHQMKKVEDNEEGWPPIKVQYRMRKSIFVKVKMEGVPIGRKIDLSLYHSYQALTHAFIAMFAKYTKNGDEADCKILYQDQGGDWRLAGDHVPWEIFVESAKRVKIVRNIGQ